MTERLKRNLGFPVPMLLSAALFWIAASSVSVQAQGTMEHQGEDRTSVHMQIMLAVKEKIPEEYRIMERTPVFPDKLSLQQGQRLYMKNCSVCHGEKGDGRGPAAAGTRTPPANFLDHAHSSIYGSGEKFWIIGQGIDESGMPAFPKLSSLERWHLVNYILNLQQKQNPSIPSEEKHHQH